MDRDSPAWCDCHNHTHEGPYLAAGDCAETRIERARQKGIHWMVVNGTREKDWETVLKLRSRCPAMTAAIGLHPHHLFSRTPFWAQILEELLTAHTGAMIGEVGLDSTRDGVTAVDQQGIFITQLEIACRLNRSVTIHCVQSWGWMLEILENGPTPETALLFHGYSGSAETVQRLLPHHAYFSFSGAVFKWKPERRQRVIQSVPEDRLLIETDAPYFSPCGSNNGNEPANLPAVAAAVAEARGITIEELRAITWRNAGRLLNF